MLLALRKGDQEVRQRTTAENITHGLLLKQNLWVVLAISRGTSGV